MKKTPIYLYILGSLSLINVLWQMKSTFFPSPLTLDYEKTGDAMADKMLAESANFQKGVAAIESDLVNKFLWIVMLVLLVAVAVFLFKKENQKAGWIYVAYLGTTLLGNAYAFLATRRFLTTIADEQIRQVFSIGINFGLGLGVLLFVIFLGITLFNLLRKPKQTSTDTTGVV